MRIYRALIPAALMLGMLALPAPSSASVSIGISVGIAPPPLPIYEQPLIPGPGYFWTPGYWAYGPLGYYWVPGTWVLPPTVGFLWTPPWWGWGDGGYLWHGGYWGPHVGFYGGINYGYGYSGVGYEGGYWDHQRFFYNREANNIGNANFANVYSKSVAGSGRADRVSFNGGTGGIAAQPTAQEQAATRDRHLQATALQTQHVTAARSSRSQLATTNNGQPPVTATSRAGRLNTPGNATALGATGAPTAQSNARTMGTGPGAPKNVVQGTSKNLGQGTAPRITNQRVATPNAQPASQGTAPRITNQRVATPNQPASQGNAPRMTNQRVATPNAQPARQGTAPRITNQRVATPNAQPSGKGAPAQGQGQPKGKNDQRPVG